MPDTTPTLGWRVPVLGDDPDIPRDIVNLANDVEADVASIVSAPSGDSSNTATLGADRLLTGSAQTVILSKTFTLTRDQQVWIEGKARIDNSGAAIGAVGVHITVDGTVNANSTAGPVNVDYHNSDRVQLSTGLVSATLAAGSHTVEFRANRDGTGQLNAIASGALSTGPTYHSTILSIIV